MANVSCYDYSQTQPLSVQSWTGIWSDIDKLKTNKLTQTATGQVTNGSYARLRLTGNALTTSPQNLGCVFIGGIGYGVKRVRVQITDSTGTLHDKTQTIYHESTANEPLIKKPSLYFWFPPFDVPNGSRSIYIWFYTDISTTFELGRIWAGPNFECEFDAGWSRKMVTNSKVNRTVAGAADLAIKGVYRELKIKSTGVHLGSDVQDIIRFGPAVLLHDLKWSDVDDLSLMKQEMVITWRAQDMDGDEYAGGESGDSYFATEAFSMYGFPKTSSGINHVTGENYELSWTIQEHL